MTTTPERDELAQTIADTRNLEYGFGAGESPSHTDYRDADAILAAGYRRPRTITTAELGALPLGSVVLDSTHTTRTYVASADGERYYADCYGEDGVLQLPATLLYDGGAV